MNPSTPLFVAVTQVSTAAITGAEQGAATNPEAAPMTNTPERLPPSPAVAARVRSHVGTRTGMTSSIANAAMIRRFAIAKYSHGLVLTEPNRVPVSPANSPSDAYASASPRTYVKVRSTVRERGRGTLPAALPPTIAAVMGIIG